MSGLRVNVNAPLLSPNLYSQQTLKQYSHGTSATANSSTPKTPHQSPNYVGIPPQLSFTNPFEGEKNIGEDSQTLPWFCGKI